MARTSKACLILVRCRNIYDNGMMNGSSGFIDVDNDDDDDD